jgi:tyrosyl-tRNA synthetase
MSAALSSNIAIAEPNDGLEEKLLLARRERRPLRVKLGFDPTAPDLHLGHAVVLSKLRDFQVAGHKVIVVIGDFTAAIGDPTGRNELRPPLSPQQIEHNSATYLDQLGRIVDASQVTVRRNSEWLAGMNLAQTVHLLAKVTLAQIMAREDFRNRSREQLPIHFHELLYPILQGYDSVAIEADIELGGTDQLFNCLVGRALQGAMGQPRQAVLTVPLLVGTDGVEKMSKSRGNYIALHDLPTDMYGKAMSIPDGAMASWLELATAMPEQVRSSLRERLLHGSEPMAVKKEIAASIVARVHGANAATLAGEAFARVVQERRRTDEDFLFLSLDRLRQTSSGPVTLLDLVHFASTEMSRGEVRRLIAGGGVRVDGRKAVDPAEHVNLDKISTLEVGRRNCYRFSATASSRTGDQASDRDNGIEQSLPSNSIRSVGGASQGGGGNAGR